MAFVPRNFEQILNDMITHVRANSTLTDFTVGSAIRTILEASALEDDEQYYQMVRLLDAFRIQTATGTELDERVADYNIVRYGSKSAFTDSIVFQNGGLTTELLEFNVLAGSNVLLTLPDTSNFPVAPFTTRVGEGTPSVEDVTITNNDTTNHQLKAATLIYNHSAGDRVSLVTGGDKVINSGQQIQVPPKAGSSAITFSTLETGTIVAGNYESGYVQAKATSVGKKGNVTAGQISQFQGSPPFTGALVTNKKSTTGGRDAETDVELRSRAMARLNALSRGTRYAIEGTAIGVEDQRTGQRVITAKIREDFSDPTNNILYIDDGSGFTPSKTILATSSLVGLHGIGVTTLTVNNVEPYPSSGWVLIDPQGTNPELIYYTSKGTGNTINLNLATSYSHASGIDVLLVDLVETAEEGQNFFQTSDFPIVKGTFDLYDDAPGIFTERVEGVDYLFNRTNGEVQYLGSGLPKGTLVIANYSFYTGLVQEVQKVITGDPNDRSNYPGVIAAGIMVAVSTPVIRRVTVIVTLTAKVGFSKSELRDSVQREIEAYIDGLLVGDNVYRAKIVEVTMQVEGVENVIVQSPSSDVVILENELPVSFDFNGNSLVTVL